MSLLAGLAAIPQVHLVASCSHMRTGLLWDATKARQFNWAWVEAHTASHYASESVDSMHELLSRLQAPPHAHALHMHMRCTCTCHEHVLSAHCRHALSTHCSRFACLSVLLSPCRLPYGTTHLSPHPSLHLSSHISAGRGALEPGPLGRPCAAGTHQQCQDVLPDPRAPPARQADVGRASRARVVRQHG